MGKPIPGELSDALLLIETGWSPDVLDSQPESRINNYRLMKAIKNVVENHGDLNL